jgi:hypothetical protein
VLVNKEKERIGSCIDCKLSVGGCFWRFDFDHVRGKKVAGVSTMVHSTGRFKIDEIKREIDKCELRCKNCHRRVTSRRRELESTQNADGAQPEASQAETRSEQLAKETSLEELTLAIRAVGVTRRRKRQNDSKTSPGLRDAAVPISSERTNAKNERNVATAVELSLEALAAAIRETRLKRKRPCNTIQTSACKRRRRAD